MNQYGMNTDSCSNGVDQDIMARDKLDVAASTLSSFFVYRDGLPESTRITEHELRCSADNLNSCFLLGDNQNLHFYAATVIPIGTTLLKRQNILCAENKEVKHETREVLGSSGNICVERFTLFPSPQMLHN